MMTMMIDRVAYVVTRTWFWRKRSERLMAFAGPVVPLENQMTESSSTFRRRDANVGKPGEDWPGLVCRGLMSTHPGQPSPITNTCNAVNPLESSRGNYSATSNNTKLVHWPLMSGLLHLVQRGGNWAGPQLAQTPPRCTKCNSPPINRQCTDHRIAVCCSAVLMRP